MLLANRVAVVTGGARGIGKGIALKFSEEGCSVVITDVLAEEAGNTVEEILGRGKKGSFVPCDVSRSDQVQEMVAWVIRAYGKVDILVNNAGIGGIPKPISQVSEEEWDRLLSINLKGAFLCCKAVVPYMKEKRHGKIINMSSMGAIAPPTPNIHYSAAKSGILGLTLDLALELAPYNICVNAILPGAIPTDMWDPLLPPGIDKNAFFAEVGKTAAPMQRVGTPEEVAGAALFLASDLSSYVTGDRILVGGGAPLVARLK